MILQHATELTLRISRVGGLRVGCPHRDPRRSNDQQVQQSALRMRSCPLNAAVCLSCSHILFFMFLHPALLIVYNLPESAPETIFSYYLPDKVILYNFPYKYIFVI